MIKNNMNSHISVVTTNKNLIQESYHERVELIVTSYNTER